MTRPGFILILHVVVLIDSLPMRASAYKLTWYAAAYVVIAETSGFPSVTADEVLLRKMKGHRIVLRLNDLVCT